MTHIDAASSASRPRAARLALRVAVALNIALALVTPGLWLIAVRQGLSWRADYSAFYTGWAIVRDGQGARLYDYALQAEVQRAALDGRSFADGLLPYINPPHLTLPFVPLALLPLPASYGAWALIQLLLVAAAVRLTLALDPGQPRSRAAVVAVTLLAFPPLIGTLLRGTFSLLILVALLLAYLALGRGRDLRAGLWLLLVTLKPQLILAPAAAALAGRRWRALLALGLSGAAALAASLAVFGWQAHLDYLGALAAHNLLFGRNGVDPATMPNLRGALTLLLTPARAALINGLSTLALAAAAVGLLWLWRGPWRPESPAFALRFALSVTLGLIFTPHLNTHDLLLLALPIALLAAHLRPGSARPAAAATLLLLPLGFLLGEVLLGPLLQLALMAALAIWIAAELRRTP